MRTGNYTLQEYIRELNPDNDFLPATTGVRQLAVFKREDHETRCIQQTAVHRRGFYKVSLITGGGGTFTIDGHTFPIQPPMIVVSRPDAVMQWDLADGQQTGFYALFAADFYDVGLLPLYRLEKILPAANFFYQTIDAADSILPAFQQLYQHREQPELARHCLRLLMAGMLELCPQETAVNVSRRENIVRDFQWLIKQKLEEGAQTDQFDLLSVKAYAAWLHIDENYLSILCREVTGKNATAIIREKVAAEAAFLLLGSDAAIGEIAHRLCFYDVAHFSNWFRKAMQLWAQGGICTDHCIICTGTLRDRRRAPFSTACPISGN
ncbi:helix-turn-helix transcriptional regulator [Chitinophaga sp. G-6-1-13]|uniref:Helix-turn-helix transcriptional regulator n=1 Tax=Chitinophaga fulva TaxID=2728842 RepID=A0A848GPM5_9BACT|nr:AraC family transcriptional regulator [Chitinophaga fulva]NML39501.1 helix-turn-helix transcriptional regulator [Chitinophaga fulva]